MYEKGNVDVQLVNFQDFANIRSAVVHGGHIVIHRHSYIAVIVVTIRIYWKKSNSLEVILL